MGNDDGKLYCINTDGSLNFYYHSGFQIRTSPGILEYDEMLFIVYGDNNGMIYMINAVGSLVEGWPLQFSQDIYTSPLAADLDSDGSPEIISAAKYGLSGKLGSKNIIDIAEEMLRISSLGLERRNRLDDRGIDERQFLDPLINIIRNKKTGSEILLDKFNGIWKKNIDNVFIENAF